MSMRLSKNVVRFRLGQVPAVGNVETGAIVGLSGSGAALCDAMAAHDVPEEDVPADCAELVAYMKQHGFIEAGTDEGAVHLGRARLRSAYLHVTNRCNLSCVGCYSRDEGRNRDEDPTFDQLAHAVDVLAELGVEQLIVSGGEPFLREDLAELAAHAKQGGIATVIILTNGMLCTDERIAPLAGKVDTISVSFDGPSSQSPSYIRGKQLFDRLVEVIKRIKGAGIQAHILPTIHAKNIDDVPAYLELGKQLGATVGFSLLSGLTDTLGDLAPSDDDFVRLAEVMQAAGATAGVDSVFLDGAQPTLQACACCGAGKTGVSVAADGSVYPCHMLHYVPFLLGNAFEDSTDTLRDSLARFALPAVDELDGCKDCNKRYLCGGGCRARAYMEYGRADCRDPYCAYNKRSIEDAVSFVLAAMA